MIADLIADELKEQGCDVVGPVPRVEQGVGLAQTERLDCALLDIDLAGEMSFPIAAVLVARGVPFAFLTGFTFDQTVLPRSTAASRASPSRSTCATWWPSSPTTSRRRRDRHRRDDHLRIGVRVLVGHRQIDPRRQGRRAPEACANRSAAPPSSRSVGWPLGRLTTPRSDMKTPRAKPVPSALAQASLAANRLA